MYVELTLCISLSDAVVYSDERFGVSGVRSGLSYLSCSNSATSLSQCNAVRKGQGGCYLSISQCGTEMGLQCYSKFDLLYNS